ncbi:SOS response-associated peptidase [Aspergillus tanneri]|uniref:DUF159 domain protein n=1 Tax=Aspergillus tanneri TaxID=1220188 RepID=A0A5M9MX02_9EURO|nr:uncharacterized protein ATNIH1004_002549 [Aspergillus tanneri]KAA8649870.1 hypothetical protein ATNIH1004_002549 [Aspergillus tanneri]
MSFIRYRMQEQGMRVDDAPPDEDIRETFNFAPGNFGAVYRADSPSHHPRSEDEQQRPSSPEQEDKDREEQKGRTNVQGACFSPDSTKYKLQSMKWGLVPFWTKRQPDYGSLMRTINCRDDSLIDDRGMWTSMKRKKRCVVVCQGFYEWLKKGPGGKEKIPHFTKRKDGDLMYFAGLWDCVSYDGEGGSEEPLFTYTVITTSSNPYLKFLHDRMPVILEPNSEAMRIWLDPNRTTWSKDLQSVLKPYEGELECYPVPKEVGKVGNNSPDFIVPVSSKENKSNIANFFANVKQRKAEPAEGLKLVKDEDGRSTKDTEWSEENAPKQTSGVKREHPEQDLGDGTDKKSKIEERTSSPTKARQPSKHQALHSGRKTRSATVNQKPLKKTTAKKPTDRSQRITNFFGK